MNANAMQHVIITGHGRSGTNLVLDILDASANTICRNEANEIPGACLNRLEPGFFPPETQDDDMFEMLLNESIHYRSGRDRFKFMHKNFYSQAILQSAYMSMLQSAHLRKALHPFRAQGEWKLPEEIYDAPALNRVVAVHKILLWPGRLCAAHVALEHLRIVHVIRDPKDFLQSWFGRYVANVKGGPEQVFADNQSSVDRIMPYFGGDAQTLYAAGYTEEALVESEMWRWRYMNELLFEALNMSQRYLVVTYPEATGQTVDVAERLADFCDLRLDSGMRARVSQNKNTLFAPRKRHPLDDQLVSRVVDRVLANSPLNDLKARLSLGGNNVGAQ